jgi:hypothetical protein
MTIGITERKPPIRGKIVSEEAMFGKLGEGRVRRAAMPQRVAEQCDGGSQTTLRVDVGSGLAKSTGKMRFGEAALEVQAIAAARS